MVLHCLISRRVPVCIIYSYISVLIDDDNITYRGSKTRYENDGIEILSLAHCRQLLCETPVLRRKLSCRFHCSNTISCSTKRSSSFFRNSVLNFFNFVNSLWPHWKPLDHFKMLLKDDIKWLPKKRWLSLLDALFFHFLPEETLPLFFTGSLFLFVLSPPNIIL